jgi:hypothetical protein
MKMIKTVHDSARPAQVVSNSQIRTVTVWLSAFIPRNLGEQTTVVSQGPYQGQTMLVAPVPKLPCYLTDDREFSVDPSARSRMHSAIRIDTTQAKIIRQEHRCDPTIELDCATGIVTCEEAADTSSMSFSDLRKSSDGNKLEVDLHGSSKNACLKVANVRISPNLDYQGTLTIELRNDGKTALVWFRGKIEIYPSFEMYASANEKAAKVLFQVSAQGSSSPLNLIGPPALDIYGEAELTG